MPPARAIGRHNGIHRFTVGQRRGLDIGGSAEPLYVIAIDAAGQPRDRRAARRAGGGGGAGGRHQSAGAARWPDVMVKVRSLAPLGAGGVGRRHGWRFDAPLLGVAPGQAAVAYRGSRVIGGAHDCGDGAGDLTQSLAGVENQINLEAPCQVSNA